ncbi:hypothetical protein CO614_01550 [Lysobacteraceae bacterium NML120232]|nr:hypothetical protein CO608_01265 [Xanthomonadaceae bacterium NML08-0793]PJK13381.1 hypothetical protein CO614_01550 [Xanthomonadaceae bacterium NML120232]
MQWLYLALCLIGAVLPLAQFIPWLAEHGLHLRLMWQQIQGDRLSAFAWADVVASALALPLFLWLRQRHLDHASSQEANP